MSDAAAVVFTVLLFLAYGKICGIRDQLKRIADFCERAEARMKR